MSNMALDQKDFMLAGDQSTKEFNHNQVKLYYSLIKEEANELFEALEESSNEEIIKEAMDVIVVTLGLVWSMGIDPNKCWTLVHQNNMAKVINTDVIVKDENGKILKSPESKARKEQMMKGIKGLLNVY